MTTAEIVAHAMEHDAAQHEDELRALVELVASQRPRVVVEIGTLKGGTLAAWCQCAAPDALIISIDLENGPWCGPRFVPAGYDAVLQALPQPEQEFHLLRSDSRDPDTLQRVVDLLAGRPIEFLFIDGNHELEPVTSDYETFAPLVAPGGVVALHDILPISGHPDCRVHELWARLKSERPSATRELIGDSHPQHWGGIGVLAL